MQRIARKKGGECLSKQYVNSNTKLKWKCKRKHIWEALLDNIMRGHWCPYCAGQVVSIDDMKKLAKTHDGICLSKKYLGAAVKLKWKCNKGHIWKTSPHCIKNGAWCPYCAGQIKPSIKDLQSLAASKGGKCLSRKYIRNKDKIIWQCKNGHLWQTATSNIKSGRWCPICSLGVGERICRKYFETIFRCSFPKARPKWLINARDNQMELDGYCEKRRLAFEYQGEQHNRKIAMYHSGRSFEQQKADDQRKLKLCVKHNILLISIPYFYDNNVMGKYIVEKCKKLKLLPKKYKRHIDYTKFKVFSPDSLDRMKKIAKDKQGRCLSRQYINAHTKMRWRCKKGHIWEAIPNNIQRGSWCPYCFGRNKWQKKK